MCKRLSSQTLTFVSYAQVGRLNCIRTRDARGYESNVRITRGTETWDNFDKNGNKVFDASYDAWGRQTVTLNTIGLHRGYTGDDMLTEFDIINMNGRLYDPVLGRFLSPDNYVQLPDNSQSFNRYSYCLNNPLKYTDSDGEWFGIDDLLIAGAGFVTGYLANSISSGNWGWSSVKSGIITAATSWIGFNTAGLGAGSITKSTWGEVGKICINGFLSKVSPSFSVPIGNHFGLSLSVTSGFGEDGLTVGMFSSMYYSNNDFYIGVGGGVTNHYYGWNIESSYKGWGAGYGKSYYNEEMVKGNFLGKQIVGTITLLARGKVSFRLSNDMFGKNGNDRWRTSAAELSIGDFSIGTYVLTNNGRVESDDHYDLGLIDPILGYNPEREVIRQNHRKKTGGGWPKGKVYSAPFWLGIKSDSQIYRLGYSAQVVQSLTQNAVHRYIVPTPYFIPGNEFYQGAFSYFGYNSPLSIW